MSVTSQEMAKFLMERGWSFAGNCGCAANESRYTNSKYPSWKIKTLGHGMMVFQQQQNPHNRRDFKTVNTSGKDNYSDIYSAIFTAVDADQQATNQTTA